MCRKLLTKAMAVIAMMSITFPAVVVGTDSSSLVEIDTELIGFTPDLKISPGDSCVAAFGAGFETCREKTTSDPRLCFSPLSGDSCCDGTWACPGGSYCFTGASQKCCPNELSVEECAASLDIVETQPIVTTSTIATSTTPTAVAKTTTSSTLSSSTTSSTAATTSSTVATTTSSTVVTTSSTAATTSSTTAITSSTAATTSSTDVPAQYTLTTSTTAASTTATSITSYVIPSSGLTTAGPTSTGGTPNNSTSNIHPTSPFEGAANSILSSRIGAGAGVALAMFAAMVLTI